MFILVSVLPMRCKVDKFLSWPNAEVATKAETAKVMAEILVKLTRYSLRKKGNIALLKFYQDKNFFQGIPLLGFISIFY